MVKPVTTVVLGFEDMALSEEVLSFFDRDSAFAVLGAVSDQASLSRLVHDAHPGAVVGSPEVLARAERNGEVRLAVAERESVAELRAAIRSGAAGFYLWPQDRDRLAGDAARLVRRRDAVGAPPGQTVAVYGPRGGAGATFVATNLAAAASKLGTTVCLVECDPFFADLSAALGVAADAEVRTLDDLLPVLDEIGPEHVEDVLYRHPAGFAAVLGPRDPVSADLVEPAQMAGLVEAVRASHEMVVVHPGRSLDGFARAALGAADRILLVVALDVLGLRDARRALSFLEGAGLRERCELVVNRAARGDVIPGDAERVLGLSPLVVLGVDRSVGRAQDRGELVFGRSGRTSRGFVRLAKRLIEVAA